MLRLQKKSLIFVSAFLFTNIPFITLSLTTQLKKNMPAQVILTT
jgi:hypothetical protein